MPQGSFLSVTLFSLKINSVANSIPRGVTCSMYVDDLLVCYSGKNMATIERQLQLCLNKVHNWSVANGFKFSKWKTVCMHFCHLRTLHPDPSLTMDGDPIKVVKQMRFLGLVFDTKLSFLLPMSLKASGIHLCWLPGHVGIRGNERADRATKTARRTDMQPCLIPPTDFKPIIHKHITAMWQNTWDESPLNKLHEIAPIVNEPRTHHLSTRRDQSIFIRCRMGHSRLTHEFLLKGEPPPECIPCNCPLTIKHLLIECVDFNDVRQRLYQVPSLQDLFKTVKPEVILEFLKAAVLYRLVFPSV